MKIKEGVEGIFFDFPKQDKICCNSKKPAEKLFFSKEIVIRTI
jgi:hypothetical protein